MPRRRKKRAPVPPATTALPSPESDIDLERAWMIWPRHLPHNTVIIEDRSTFYAAREEASTFFGCSPLDLTGCRLTESAEHNPLPPPPTEDTP